MGPMKGREAGQASNASSLSLAGRVAQGLRASLDDPRRLARDLIREKLGDAGPFMGDGTAETPWLVWDREDDFYLLYVRGRELVQMVHGRPDGVVCVL